MSSDLKWSIFADLFGGTGCAYFSTGIISKNHFVSSPNTFQFREIVKRAIYAYPGADRIHDEIEAAFLSVLEYDYGDYTTAKMALKKLTGPDCPVVGEIVKGCVNDDPHIQVLTKVKRSPLL